MQDQKSCIFFAPVKRIAVLSLRGTKQSQHKKHASPSRKFSCHSGETVMRSGKCAFTKGKFIFATPKASFGREDLHLSREKAFIAWEDLPLLRENMLFATPKAFCSREDLHIRREIFNFVQETEIFDTPYNKKDEHHVRLFYML